MNENTIFELTNPQKSIWLTEQYYKGTNINTICGTMIFDENFSVDLLKETLKKFLKINDSMRTRIILKDGIPMQFISDEIIYDIETFSLNGKEELNKLEQEVSQTPFNLIDSDLYKFKIFELGDGTGGFIAHFHHLIVDAWGLGLMGTQIKDIYESLLYKKEFDENRPSYIEYIEKEKEYSKGEKYLKDVEYWENSFSQIPDLATIKPYNNSVINPKANRYVVKLDYDLCNKINDYTKNNGSSAYSFLMSVFSIYLASVSGIDNVVIGTPFLNRSNFKEKNTMGMFVNTLPNKLDLDWNLKFSEFLKYTTNEQKNMFRHSKYPYDKLLEKLRKEQNTNRNLYDITMSFQNARNDSQVSNIKYHTYWTFCGNIADSLEFHVFDLDNTGSLQLYYDYQIAKFSETEISKINERILNIINQVLENDICLKEIEIVTNEEKQQLLFAFNNTKATYPDNKTIIDLFEEQVEKTPNNIAVIYNENKLTYKELNEKANALALEIINKNISNKFICIICDKSIEMITGLLAILKSGNCYIPIDPASPENRINYIINYTDSNLLLTTQKYAEKYSVFNLICIDNIEFLNENINNSRINDPAYIIFTSGTTGTPKGVEVLNESIINTLLWRKKYYNFDSSTVTLQLPSFAFDSSVEDIFTTLISGGKLVIPVDKINNIDSLKNEIIKNNVTHFLITPALYNIFLEDDCSKINSLQNITVAGEAFSIDLVKKHFNKFPNVRLLNEYGPTENSVCSTVFEFTKDSDSVLIGKPIDNNKAYVLSKTGNLLPIGIPGELCFSGKGIVNGYLNNKNLTDEKFIINKFFEERMYKTGDIAKWMPDGNLEFIERIDNQVKIRGYRIELAEIDKQILQNDFNITQSVTVVHNINNSKQLCTYITGKESIDVNDLKSNLKQFLPTYMIPTYIMQIDNIPLNINGKIDRKKLPMPSTNNKNIVLPRNVIETTIVSVLKNILKIENISVADSFYDLGGDSLSAILFAGKISNELDVSINVQDIFKYPIIENLADYIKNIKNNVEDKKIQRIERRNYYPLSSAQKRIYYASILDNDSILYNSAGGIIIDKNLDITKLKNCLEELTKRHDALRTRFDIIDDEVVQIIEDKIDFKLEIGVADENDISNIYNSFIKPFNLAEAPLFRVKVCTLNNNQMLLLLDMHHIINDGASSTILLQELCDLYNNKQLPENEVDYKDFTLWEKEQFETNSFKEAKDFWINQYKDNIPLLNMPTTFNRPSVQSFEGTSYFTSLPEDVYNKVLEISKKLGITPYMLMISCFYILLSKYSSQDDIIIGTPIIGRNKPELMKMLGMFVNTLALRNKVDYSLNFNEFTNTIKNNCLNAFKYQIYPFDYLVKDLNIKRDTSRNPLFDIMFIYQNDGYPKINFENGNIKYIMPNNKISKFDLSLEVIPINNEYKLRFEYCTKLFDEKFIEQLSNHYINILNSVLNNSEIKLSDIDLFSETEKNKILYEFNNTKIDYSPKTISQLFEEQVQITPNNIAVVFGNQKLTYKELNEKANSLAFYLRNSLNVNKNDIIGVMVNRSLEVLVSILAIIKAGGTYIPIDPSFPKERIDYMLESSNAKLLLTNKNLEEKINYTKKILVDLEEDNIIYNYPKENLCCINTPDDLLYIIFTSGSTGKPKGVMITHKVFSNFTNYCNNYVEYLKDSTNQAIVSITTISFDIFAYETLISLQKGLKVIIANENEQTTPYLLNNLMKKNNAQIIQATPSIMQIFVNNLQEMPALKNLKYVILAGEQLPLNLVHTLHNLSNIVVYNGYGPSETYYCTLTEVNDEIVTIGKPIYNSQMYILDQNLKPVPIGTTGEIYISGECVGNGYLNNIELTNKTFIPNPFIDGITMYKSGDLGKYLDDGNIICLGRSDNQIKIRGQRIESDEIEANIMKYPNITKVCIVKQSVQNREFITAYFTANKRISISELRKYLSKLLPRYMVPSYYIPLDDFPYTPNGKIDKKVLPLPTEILNINKETYVAPTTELQKKLVAVWEKILNTTPIGITDNFFELGGDSILAINLNIELQKISHNITYSDIFRFPTISELEEKMLTENNTVLSSRIEKIPESYTAILNNCLQKSPIKSWKPKNILLTGSTGYLGIHILNEFLKKQDGKVYCIIRNEPGLTSEMKIYQKLNYYFKDTYNHLIGERIIPITGDITKPGFGLNQKDLLELANNIDVVINCAALVSHFGNYNSFYNINVRSVKYIIDFCQSFNKKLYHISTTGIAGKKIDNPLPNNTAPITFNEGTLYFGQDLDNVYIRSKFEAERLIIDSINNGVDSYILRMGNLMPRYMDGVFQENVSSNGFANDLVAFIKIGSIPESLLKQQLDFTPIDIAASAIYSLITNPSDNNRIFHIYNKYGVSVNKFLKLLKKYDFNISILSDEEFKNKIKNILNDETRKNSLGNLLNYFNSDLSMDYGSDIIYNSNFSFKYLEKIHFRWCKITNNYLINFINILRRMM